MIPVCVVGVEWIGRQKTIIYKVSKANKCRLW